MCKDRHLIRLAGRIHRQLSNPANATRPAWHAAATELISRLSYMELHWLAASKAQDRGWHAAARARQQEVLAEAMTQTAEWVDVGHFAAKRELGWLGKFPSQFCVAWVVRHRLLIQQVRESPTDVEAWTRLVGDASGWMIFKITAK